MDTRTGAIARFETDEDAKRAGYKKPLTEPEVLRLFPKTRAERLQWLTKEEDLHRLTKVHPAVPGPDETPDDIRKNRNARKRKRQGR
jgi:hypothetical protein